MPIPPPLIVLLAAAAFAGVAAPLDVHTAEPIAIVALLVLLLDGGLDIGWQRMRGAAGPVLGLGILGTFVTAAAVALVAHHVLGFGWTASGLLGAALAPTDPAMVFAVLRGRELRGNTKAVLEGEAGFNDPAGIALMLGLIELATHDDKGFGVVATTFVLQMAVGVAVGVGAGMAIRRVGWAVPIAAAAYGLAVLGHGSGFLAVFVAGLLGGRGGPRFVSAAEFVLFMTLGLTVPLLDLSGDVWRDGLILALAVGVVRMLMLVPTTRARAFIGFAGLKGAVPILLGALAITGGAPGAHDLYGVIFVAVAVNVLVQGTLLPTAASRLGLTS